MYFCHNCKTTFGFPSVQIDEYVEAWGRAVPRTVDLCPHCGSQDFKELWRKCSICEELIVGKYIHTVDGMDICKDCCFECNEVDDV